MDVSQTLQQAIAALNKEDRGKAKQLLAQVLQTDPRNESAWLWLVHCVDKVEHKHECFERVLAINPDNNHAIEGLKRLEVLAKAEASPSKRKKITKQQTRLVLGLGVAVLAIAFIGIVSIGWAINSGLLPLGPAAPAAVGITPAPSLTSPPVAHQPGLTVASSTATPVTTWTPKPSPTSIPTPDVRAEIEAYLGELDPLLVDMEDMWWEWHAWYGSLNGGKEMTSDWCLSYGHTLDTRYRELEAKHMEIVADIANLTPPRQLKHAHDKLVSAYRHKKECHFLNFRACAEHRFQLWETAGIEDHYYAEEKQAAFDEIREVLNRLGIEREDMEG